MAKGKELETVLRLMGEVDPSVKKAMASAAKEIAALEKKTKKSATGVGTIVKGILTSNAILGAGRGLMRIVGGAVDKFKELAGLGIEYASDLGEAQNVVDTTFGKNSKAIDAWSKTALKKFGMSELAAKNYASTMGSMLKPSGLEQDTVDVMSISLSGLAADIGSYRNMDTEEVFHKLMSAMSGEAEPVKMLGFDVRASNLEAFAKSKGIKAAIKDLSQADRYLLTYNYLMEASIDMQNDFSDTLKDSYENQKKYFESLKMDALGKVFKGATPALTGIYEKLNTTLEKIDWDKIGDSAGILFGKLTDDVAMPWLDKLANADWDKISGDVSDFVLEAGDIASGLAEWVKDQDWKALMDSLSSIIHNFDAFLSDPIEFVLHGAPKKRNHIETDSGRGFGNSGEPVQTSAEWQEKTSKKTKISRGKARPSVVGDAPSYRDAGLQKAANNDAIKATEKSGATYQKMWGASNKHVSQSFSSAGKTVQSTMENIPQDAKQNLDQVNQYLSGPFTTSWQTDWTNITTIATNAISQLSTLKPSLPTPSPSISPGLALKPSPVSMPKSVLTAPKQYAAGGITDGISIAGEGRAPEYVIPTDPRYRNRAQSLLASASQALGVGQRNASFGGNITLHYQAPNITSQGGGLDRATLVQILREDKQEVIEMLREMLMQEFDSSFNGELRLVDVFGS